MISLPSCVQSIQGIPEKLHEKRKKLIIDTDGGSDDVHAIITAVHCARQSNSQILGITCVSGNTQLPLVLKNIKIALTICDAPEIQIYAGCDRALNQSQWMDNFFLEDGLSLHQQNYINSLNIEQNGIEQKQHAVDFIIENVKKYNDDLSIIVIGPMTNIACALIKDKSMEKLMSSILFLGGNICGLGIVENGVKYVAEFNAYTDVEAIHLVYKVLQDKVIMIPYESVFTVPEEHIQNTFGYTKSHRGIFVNKIYQSMFGFLKRYDVQDPLPVIIAMYPEVVTKYIERRCSVILHGEARGMVSVDWLNTKKSDQSLNSPLTIIVGLDTKRILQILHEVIKDDHELLKQYLGVL